MNTIPIIQRLPLADIKTPDYQQNPSSPRIDRIVNRFDAAKLGTLLVSFRDGSYYILDGVHRLAALRKLGYTHCLVLATMNLEQEVNCYLNQKNNKGVRIMNPENYKATNQKIETIALNKIVPAGYQRGTKAAQVRNIIKKFNEAKLDALLVSEQEDGTYHVIDGAHRTEALREMGYTHAVARVLMGMTYEQESELFASQDEDVRRLTWLDYYKAGLIGKNEKCLKIEKILGDNGFQVGKGKDFKNISAVQTLQSIINEYGEKVLDETLFLIANTWNGLSKVTTREFLIGIAEFVHRYGMADFSERMKDKYAVVCYEYTEVIKQRAFLVNSHNTIRRSFCRVLVEQYNKGLRVNQKSYLKWEEE